jgi:hypothetical protein
LWNVVALARGGGTYVLESHPSVPRYMLLPTAWSFTFFSCCYSGGVAVSCVQSLSCGTLLHRLLCLAQYVLPVPSGNLLLMRAASGRYVFGCCYSVD